MRLTLPWPITTVGIARMQTHDYDGALADLEHTGQLPALGSTAWLETNRQSVLREQARFTLQQHLADLRSGHPGNDSMSFNYDNHEKPTSLKDVFGGETRYGYDPAGRLNHITYPDRKWTEYRYDNNGYLREMQTENGRRISYTHGAKGEWTQIEFPNKDVIRIEQDPTARSVSFSFPDGDTTRYQFDQQQRLVEVRTADQTRTNIYESSGQLRQIKWSDGRAVDFQPDITSQIRGIRDQTGQEMRQWEVTLRADEHGRVTSMTDPLERMRLQWDEAGRLRSATSDSGSKVLVHWDSETNKPRSLTTSWGSVEFDAQGRPQDLYTIEGQRWPATWRADGQLEQVMTPLFGTIRFQYEQSNQPTAIQFPDGLSTALVRDKREPTRGSGEAIADRISSTSAPSQVTIYVTDMGIHNWDKNLRMFEDFSHAKAGPIVQGVSQQGQILVPMPERMPHNSWGKGGSFLMTLLHISQPRRSLLKFGV